MNERPRKVFELSLLIGGINKFVMISSQPLINRTFSPANQFISISRCNIVVRFIC